MNWSVGAGLEGKGVIVTGASGGIGSAVAKAFGEAGAMVAAVDLDQDATQDVLNSIPGDDHIAIAADLTELELHAEIVHKTVTQFGNVFALAHLAAVARRQYSVNDVSEADWDFQVDTNLKSAFFFCREVANAMIEKGAGGRIILYSSQGWWTGGFGGSVVYCASKGGVVSMVRGLARTYGPNQITVNSIAPGAVETSMARTDLTEEVESMIIKQTPLGRFAEPVELAGITVFLASQHASYITGATINVSGGWLMY